MRIVERIWTRLETVNLGTIVEASESAENATVQWDQLDTQLDPNVKFSELRLFEDAGKHVFNNLFFYC